MSRTCGALALHLRSRELRVIPQLVRGPVLVDQPHDLAFVRDEVGRELQRDDRVDLQPVGLAHVEAAPHRHLVHDLGAGYHLPAIVTISASCPASRNDRDERPRCAARRRRARTRSAGAGPRSSRRVVLRTVAQLRDLPLQGRDLLLELDQTLGERDREIHRVAEQPVVAARREPIRRGTRGTSACASRASARPGAARRAGSACARRCACSPRTRASARAPASCRPAVGRPSPATNTGCATVPGSPRRRVPASSWRGA